MTLESFLDEWQDPSACVTVHTSGSTGKPKLLSVEKRRMMNSARITCDFLGLERGDTALLCMSTDYIAGKMMVVRTLERGLRLWAVEPSGHPMREGQQLLLLDGATGLLAPTHQLPPADLGLVAMVPLQVYNTLRVPAEADRLRQARNLIIGGGAIDDDLERELRHFPNAVWSSYGMTETLSHIALRRLSGPEASLWYTPFSGVDIRLNADGCLVINAPAVHDGLLVTHDRAEIDAEGRFRILGRMDNVIDTGGIKVQIEEVERLLRPVLRGGFMITSVPDGKFGEAIVLLIEDADAEAAMAACRRVLPKYWVPRHVVPVDRLPMTATGKPARADAARLARQKVEEQS
jgi:O-succinylbenzoic acid--CoA ligase